MVLKNILFLLAVLSFPFSGLSADTDGYRDCELNALGTKGEGCKNPQAGALIYPINLFGLEAGGFGCSGSIIYSDDEKAVVLTSGHCISPNFGLPQEDISLSFDSQVVDTSSSPYKWDVIHACDLDDPSCRLVTGDIIFYPEYSSSDPNYFGVSSLREDAAFLVIDNSVEKNGRTLENQLIKLHALWPDIPTSGLLVQLPQLGEFDKLVNQDASSLTINAIGYGLERPFVFIPPTYGGGFIGNAGIRSVTPLSFIGISRNAISFSQKLNKNEGSLCNGDSGSQIVIEQEGALPKLFAVVTSGFGEGNTACSTVEKDTRLDSPELSGFIACAAVPGDSEAVQECVNQSANALSQ